ncbi:MAG: hypothetical protein L0Y35_02135 [Flammeovirgaceae bacterium]|nr:hypothetical protein [Flammeovirgaceae bacterium]
MKTLLLALVVMVVQTASAQSTTLDVGVKFYQGKKSVEGTMAKSEGSLRFEFADQRSFDKIFVRILFSKGGQQTMEEMSADGQSLNLKSILSEVKSGENITVEFQKLEKDGAKFRLAKNKYTFTLQ